ncbi:MAG: PHP domain-containing protein [Candidatus Helarchaeota archaeon]|nr:PHP domain-containing protein [Candidatus Helarchaeota archaeon]
MIDLHIHTQFSDGQATIPEVLEIATSKKLDYIAICDHFTTTSKQNIIPTLSLEMIGKYIKEIREASSSFSTKCFVGIEIDCESKFKDIEKLPLEEFELIQFEDVFSINILKEVCDLIDKWQLQGIFCLAHPNIHLYDSSYPVNLDFIKTQLVPLLIEYNIAFELNSRYTHRWANLEAKIQALIERGVIFSIGSDAHFDGDIGEVSKQYEFLKKMGGLKNIIKLNT